MKPDFSFIIPIYAVEDCLDRCVQSVMKQTYRNIEIILVDDGSPDGCPAMCDMYEKQDSRIRVIHQENRGLSEARNTGIRCASGTYLIFLDSDDYVTTDACEKLMPYAGEGYDIIVCDGRAEGAELRLAHDFESEPCSGQAFLKKALQSGRMPMAAWLYVYRRDFLWESNLLFKRGILHEDEQFTPRAFLQASTVVNSHICLYNYVIREGSITTGKDFRKNGRDVYDTCCELLQIYRQLPDQELKDRLTDTLVTKYLSIFQVGKLYQYGKEYAHKSFVWRNAKRTKTRLKALLFCISPALYWRINAISKQTLS